MATLPIGPHRVEEMVKYCLDLAKRLLEAHGAFFPFGAVIDAAGKQSPVAGDAKVENPKAPDVYRVLLQGMRANYFKGEIVAAAIVAEATIPAELRPTHPQGLRIAVESSSISRVVFLPYVKTSAASEMPLAVSTPEAEANVSNISSVASQAGETIPGPATYEYGELIGLSVRPTIFVAETPA